MNLLVTGGAGFIGSNFIRSILEKYPEYRVINFDKLTYAGNLENLTGIDKDPRYAFEKGDICDKSRVQMCIVRYEIDMIVHFAAESHVDRSILGAAEFVRTNVEGTNVLLEVVKEMKVKRFLHVSTDEVYGSLGATGLFTESTPLSPNSPYSASKASADLLSLAYQHTFGIPVVITRCSNNYGPYQFPEKLIPLMIANALNDKPLPVYGDGMNVRDWLHVKDHCSAIDTVLHRGRIGEVYNIGGNNEKPNIEIVRLILQNLGKPESLIRYVEDRPGHDRRYAIDSSKIQKEFGWQPAYSFESGIAETIKWYVENQQWWKRIISGEYQKYYQLLYGGRETVKKH
ncbi:MAG: dTDP-glucose 4,6-dehydratase [Ignavibacteriae bacterium]|nr:MAG: dTDP-glucose 4,6-dehydratase [Ignavibacteriota bacterium]